MLKFEKFNPRKHEWRGNGWRHHVISWGMDWKGQGFRKCSEPECEVNNERSRTT